MHDAAVGGVDPAYDLKPVPPLRPPEQVVYHKHITLDPTWVAPTITATLAQTSPSAPRPLPRPRRTSPRLFIARSRVAKEGGLLFTVQVLKHYATSNRKRAHASAAGRLGGGSVGSSASLRSVTFGTKVSVWVLFQARYSYGEAQ